MTVVSIRCSECDEVKREKHIELKADGAICDECKTDIPEEVRNAGSEESEDNSDEAGVSEQEVAKADGEEDSLSDRDNGSDETAERDKKPLEESFNEQNPLDW